MSERKYMGPWWSEDAHNLAHLLAWWLGLGILTILALFFKIFIQLLRWGLRSINSLILGFSQSKMSPREFPRAMC